MVKRIIVVCILLLPALLSYSKQGKVTGKVTDDQGKPVEHCEIKAVNANYVTNSNARGEFSLAYNTDSSHSLIVSCFGYKTEEVRISDDVLWVVLKHKLNSLDAAAVDADRNPTKIKHGVLGKKHLKQNGICSEIIGSEIGIFLQGYAEQHGLLQEVYFYIAKDGIPNSRFKVHVYSVNSSFMPKDELLDSTVIIHATKGGEWVRADISSRHIPAGGGVFISMEWLSGAGNNPLMVGDDEHPEQWQFNTQVLGMTKRFHNNATMSYTRSNINHEWHPMDLRPGQQQQYLNPMIYATYTYH